MLQHQSYAKNVIFSPGNRMNEIFANVLEFMLTFVKMQNTNPSMCTNLKLDDREFWRLFKFFILYA